MRCKLQLTKGAQSQAWKASLPFYIGFLMQSHTCLPVLVQPKCGCLCSLLGLSHTSYTHAQFQLSEFSPQKRGPSWRPQSSQAFLSHVCCSPVGLLVSHRKTGGKENLPWEMPCSHLFPTYRCGFLSFCATRTMCRVSITGSHPSTISGSKCIYLVAKIYIG